MSDSPECLKAAQWAQEDGPSWEVVGEFCFVAFNTVESHMVACYTVESYIVAC